MGRVNIRLGLAAMLLLGGAGMPGALGLLEDTSVATLPAPDAATAASGDEVRAIAHYRDFEDVPADEHFFALGLRVLHRFAAIPSVGVAGAESTLQRLASDEGFTSLEPDAPLQYHLATTSFATRAAEVWGQEWWPVQSEVPPAMTTPAGVPIDGRGVSVGVVDTGINALHPDLWYAPLHTGVEPWPAKTLACTNPGLTQDLSHPYCDETVGHGTHVAGIAAGSGWAVANGFGNGQPANQPYIGQAPGATLVAAGTGAALFVLDAARGLDYMYRHADEHNIKVVNNSWGNVGGCNENSFPSTGDSIISVSNRLVADKGVVVVFSAGNYDGGATWTNTYAQNPTPGVISVANYNDQDTGTRNGAIASSSSDGCVAAGGQEDLLWTWADVAAPGSGVFSTAAYTGVVSAFGTWRVPFYTSLSGTSMAAPHIAGIVALMFQANPDLTPAQVEAILVETATPWQDSVSARSISGPAHWGNNRDPVAGFVNPASCKVSPADAAKAKAGDTSVNAEFPKFTDLALQHDADLFICKDFKRGRGMVDAVAAVQAALALAS